MKQQQKQKAAVFDPNDLDYMRSTSAAMLEQTPKQSRALLYGIVIFICIMLVWAGFAELDEVTKANGRVVPSQKVQVIQNLEGGILADILVKEGQIVEKGQVLLRIDDNNFESSFMESRLRYFEMKAKSSRLKAEAEGKGSFTVPDEVIKESIQLANNAQSLFQNHKRALKNSLNVIKHQTQKFKHQLSEAKAKVRQIGKNLKLAKKEMRIIKPLYKSGAVSQVKLIQVERQVYNFEAQYEEVKRSLPRLSESIQESIEKEKELTSNFQSKAREELNSTLAEIPIILESIESLEDKLTRTSVRSPVKGTIKQLLVNTIDGVIQPGMDLIEIVPLDDVLVVEAQIRPADIAYIYPGQKAKVKITAYDSGKYGSLEAEVIFISADSIKDDSSNEDTTFYRVKVKTDTNYLVNGDVHLPIIPGMVAEVDILTGKKTVLDYLFKPILKTKDSALTER
ncbi:MAG: HlyD family type I secretion periplasmic adaptor subunit [Pseudomonadota bacterium]